MSILPGGKLVARFGANHEGGNNRCEKNTRAEANEKRLLLSVCKYPSWKAFMALVTLVSIASFRFHITWSSFVPWKAQATELVALREKLVCSGPIQNQSHFTR